MATCPSCGANSVTDPTFEVTDVLVANPPGKPLVGGSQMKVVATPALRLAHSCGWSVIGHIEGDHLVVDDPAPNDV